MKKMPVSANGSKTWRTPESWTLPSAETVTNR